MPGRSRGRSSRSPARASRRSWAFGCRTFRSSRPPGTPTSCGAVTFRPIDLRSKIALATPPVWAMDQRLRRLWLQALQSRIFNDVVAKRIESLDRIMDGDFAYNHENGACFLVESAALDQPRADRFEVSPSGPLIGFRVSLPTGEPLPTHPQPFPPHGLSPHHSKPAPPL